MRAVVMSNLEKIPKGFWWGIWKSLKLENEPIPSKLDECYDRPEYWWEETCCQSDYNERIPPKAGVKKSQGVI